MTRDAAKDPLGQCPECRLGLSDPACPVLKSPCPVVSCQTALLDGKPHPTEAGEPCFRTGYGRFRVHAQRARAAHAAPAARGKEESA